MKKKRKSDVNLLDLIPRTAVEFETDESRIVVLLAPRFPEGFLRRFLGRGLGESRFKVTLDEIGSEVWLLCDGARTVREIGELARERFRERIEPCYDRLGVFFRQLEQAGFISYVNLEECRARAAAGGSGPA